jgi:acetate---CoA ligase (ADP-forming)
MLERLFNPQSVAVIGASQKELSIGHRIIRNLMEFGFKGAIYPINPKIDEVRGIRAYKSVLDVPTEIDVVHMPIPAAAVPEAIQECGKRGTKFVILNGGGFAETGPEGKAIEEQCVAYAKKYGIRIMGPNCQGIINTDPNVRAYCNFTFTWPDPGNVSIVALSGGVAEMIHQAIAQTGAGTRMYASNGNARDVSIPEILKHYGEDKETKVIVLYVEGLRDPVEFARVTKEITPKKPILAVKAGRTEQGAKAAASHTGGLAKKDITTDLIFKRSGIVSFHDIEELCQASLTFATQPAPKGNRVAVLTNTGGPAVIATDLLINGGMVLADLSAKTIEAQRATLFPMATFGNPVDVLATAPAAHFRITLDAFIEDDGVDSIYISYVTPFFVDNVSIAKEIVEVSRLQKKPIVCNLMTDKQQQAETVKILKEGGVPCYTFPGSASRALVALTEYGTIRQRATGKVHTFDVDHSMAASVIRAAQSSGRTTLYATECYTILNAYGIPAAPWGSAANAAEAEQVAMKLGFPVVVKIDSAFHNHKSDKGGVALNLTDSAAVRATVEQMSSTFKEPDLQFLIQKQQSGGKEIIVGGKAEDEVGHLVMFGLGGVHVEVFEDVVFQLCPVTNIEAAEMLTSVKANALIKGVRGEKGLNEEAIIELIQRVSQLLTDFPEIKEMDLNPVLACEKGVRALDAMINL